MSTEKVTAETLNSAIDFDSPFRIVSTSDSGETIIEGVSGVYSPEVVLYVDRDGNGVGEEEIDCRPWEETTCWQAITGYSGQYGYSGPTMHASEYLGGNMARDVLADDGAVYVVTAVECSPNWEASEEEIMDVRDNPAGWMLLKLKDSSAE